MEENILNAPRSKQNRDATSELITTSSYQSVKLLTMSARKRIILCVARIQTYKLTLICAQRMFIIRHRKSRFVPRDHQHGQQVGSC